MRTLPPSSGGWRRGIDDAASRRLLDIPALGLLTATAAVATIGEAKAFRSECEFAAFVGLVPRHRGTGGRVKLLGISKRGDVYLRTLLSHGALAVITHGKQRYAWLEKLLARSPFNAAAVALGTHPCARVYLGVPCALAWCRPQRVS
jgi:transposase